MNVKVIPPKVESIRLPEPTRVSSIQVTAPNDTIVNVTGLGVDVTLKFGESASFVTATERHPGDDRDYLVWMRV